MHPESDVVLDHPQTAIASGESGDAVADKKVHVVPPAYQGPADGLDFWDTLRQTGHHEAAAEFSRAFGVYGHGMPTHSVIRMICVKHHLVFHDVNAETTTYSRAGCAVSVLIFVTALVVLHVMMAIVR